MIGLLLNRWKEGKALRTVEAALQGGGAQDEAINAIQTLRDIGSKRSIPTLCLALTHGGEALRAVAPAALAGIHKRHNDNRILEAINTAVLSDRQADTVRVAAIEALGEAVDVRHAASLLEVLKSPRSPLAVRTAAAHTLHRLGYPDLLERLVENYLFERKDDPHGAVRQWVEGELKALDDREKLSKLNEIAHGRRRLRYHSLSSERGDPGDIVHLMAEVDPVQSVRYLSQMADHSTTVISAAAAKALRDIRGKQEPDGGRHPQQTMR